MDIRWLVFTKTWEKQKQKQKQNPKGRIYLVTFIFRTWSSVVVHNRFFFLSISRQYIEHHRVSLYVINKVCTPREAQNTFPLSVQATTRSGYMMTSPTFAKWRPRRETWGKVTSGFFAAPRSVFSPYYFESRDFRQWEIRGVKKKFRPMNVERSWEVKRQNTRVFQLKEMPDKAQNI